MVHKGLRPKTYIRVWKAGLFAPKWYAKIRFLHTSSATTCEYPILVCGCLCHPRVNIKSENNKKSKKNKTLEIPAAAMRIQSSQCRRWQTELSQGRHPRIRPSWGRRRWIRLPPFDVGSTRCCHPSAWGSLSRPPLAVGGLVPADPTVEGPVATDPAIARLAEAIQPLLSTTRRPLQPTSNVPPTAAVRRARWCPPPPPCTELLPPLPLVRERERRRKGEERRGKAKIDIMRRGSERW